MPADQVIALIEDQIEKRLAAEKVAQGTGAEGTVVSALTIADKLTRRCFA